MAEIDIPVGRLFLCEAPPDHRGRLANLWYRCNETEAECVWRSFHPDRSTYGFESVIRDFAEVWKVTHIFSEDGTACMLMAHRIGGEEALAEALAPYFEFGDDE